LYSELAKISVQPGAWLRPLYAKPSDRKSLVIARPLTRGLRNAPGGLYLVAVHKERPNLMEWPWLAEDKNPVRFVFNTRILINTLIYPTKDWKRMFECVRYN
jgi:hypothetical protein